MLKIDLKMAAWGVLARLMDDQRHILDQVDQLMLHVYLTTNLKLRKKQIGYLQRLAGKEYNLTLMTREDNWDGAGYNDATDISAGDIVGDGNVEFKAWTFGNAGVSRLQLEIAEVVGKGFRRDFKGGDDGDDSVGDGNNGVERQETAEFKAIAHVVAKQTSFKLCFLRTTDLY